MSETPKWKYRYLEYHPEGMRYILRVGGKDHAAEDLFRGVASLDEVVLTARTHYHEILKGEGRLNFGFHKYMGAYVAESEVGFYPQVIYTIFWFPPKDDPAE